MIDTTLMSVWNTKIELELSLALHKDSGKPQQLLCPKTKNTHNIQHSQNSLITILQHICLIHTQAGLQIVIAGGIIG